MQGYLCKNHPLFNTYHQMRSRCLSKLCNAYPSYGGRGVKICRRWLDSFEHFVEDMGPRPKGFTLGRIDNDGDYCPENCHWEDRRTQCLNRRRFKNNTSGVTGVRRSSLGFVAVGAIYGKNVRLGTFATEVEAQDAVFEFHRSGVKPERAANLNGSTGVRGVSRHKSGYVVRVTEDGVRKYIGHYTTLATAISAKEEYEKSSRNRS